jgi:hypothetical protein
MVIPMNDFFIGLITGIISSFLVTYYSFKFQKSKNIKVVISKIKKTYGLDQEITIPGISISNYTGKDKMCFRIFFDYSGNPIPDMFKEILIDHLYTDGWLLQLNNEETLREHFFYYANDAEDFLQYPDSPYSRFIDLIEAGAIGYSIYKLKNNKKPLIGNQSLSDYKLVKKGFLSVDESV